MHKSAPTGELLSPRHSLQPAAEPRWYACYTRARHEKQVAARLKQRSIECFCPLLSLRRQWHDRVKVVEMPLFPSYVFVHCPLSEMSGVLGTPGAVTVVTSGGEAVPIPAEEIENVRRFVAALRASGGSVEPVPLVEQGTRVRIVSGPFIGVEGMVIQHRGRDRVLVGLEAIAQSWEIEVPATCMEPIREPSGGSSSPARRSGPAGRVRSKSYV